MARHNRLSLAACVVVVLGAARCTNPEPAAQSAQGWSDGQRMAWYTASQGSRLIPQAWLDNLEQPSAAAPFLDAAYITQFRYLSLPAGKWVGPDPGCPLDPKLPLGFTVDCQSDAKFKVTKLQWETGRTTPEPWVGMNCSACHTNRIDSGAQSIFIDGAPTLADFQSFMEALQTALQNTFSDADKFGRFSAAVLGKNPAPGDADRLKASMASLIAWNDNLSRLNDPAVLRYGYGRLDAIGHIFNKVALAAADGDAHRQVSNPSDAPVSYPFLWNVPQLDRVEWNGIAPNSAIAGVAGHAFNYGGLGRNTGEVIGVFADLVLMPNPAPLGGYVSSANVTALNEMENQIAHLRPPKWPAMFPAPDAAEVATGHKLFSDHCSACHVMTQDTDDLTVKYKTVLQRAFPAGPDDHSAAGTDMWMACNAVMDQARSGVVQGNKTAIISGAPLPVAGPSLDLVQHAVTGALVGHNVELIQAGVQDLFGFAPGLPQPGFAQRAAPGQSPKDVRRAACLGFKQPDPPNIVYKARPLQGIWATAPYLHNGSVPTLYDMLLPPAQRPATFFVGSRQFDPGKVGFVTAKSDENSFEFDTVDTAGEPIDGNSNAGHDYGNASFSDADRMALIAYMKTL